MCSNWPISLNGSCEMNLVLEYISIKKVNKFIQDTESYLIVIFLADIKCCYIDVTRDHAIQM